jgi:hypothetical protein
MTTRVLALALVGLPAAAMAQVTITPIVMQGDSVPGVGLVTSIENVAVNNLGQWIVQADTDNADTNADDVLIKNGALYLREGQTVTVPTGGTLDAFDSINLNSLGNSGWNFFLAGTGGLSTDSGMFFNGTLMFQESTVSTASGFSANTPYIGFFESKINDSNQVFIVASVDDPAIASTVDRALVTVSYNPVAGTYTEAVLAKEGDTLPGMPAAAADFGTSPQNFSFNNAGDSGFIVTTSSGTTDAIYRNMTQLAIEGGGSPVTGRNWSSLGSSAVAINNSGGHAYNGTLAGDTATNLLIVKNGAKFIQKGDPVPGMPSFTIEGFGTTPQLSLSDSGQLLWFGDWNDPATTRDTGLFLDGTLLIQEGVTTVNGLVVQSIVNVQNAYTMSPNGRYIICRVTLAGDAIVRSAALLITVGAPCYANCDESSAAPILNANDFQCFLNRYAAGESYANCDGSTGNPVLNANDFQCFLNAFAIGCS